MKQRLVEAKAKNPRISVRSFARTLDLPASTVSLILLGKRTVSEKLATKLASALKFDPIETKSLSLQLQTLRLEKRKKRLGSHSPHVKSRVLVESHKPTVFKLSDEQFRSIQEWYYFGILSLVQTDDFQLSDEWIALRLNITAIQAKEALKRLFDLKLLVTDKIGKVQRGYQTIRTSDGLNDPQLRAVHRQNLKLASDALENVPYEKADYTSINLPVNSKKLDEMKEVIREFEFAFMKQFALKQGEGADEVYRVCVQAFPVTRRQAK